MKKSILALAVSFASMHALAQQVTINDSNGFTGFEQAFDHVIIDGSYTGTNPGINIYNSSVFHRLENNADIDSTATGAIRLEYTTIRQDTALAGLEEGGDIINRGSVKATGINAEAVSLVNSSVSGYLLNDGKIEVVGLPTDNFIGAKALSIVSSQMVGQIRNEGELNAIGAESTALYVSNSTLFENELINKGTISATGEHTTGIEMRNTAFGGTIFNDGLITTDGAHSTGIDIDQFNTLWSIDNGSTGQIISTGEGSVAIQIDGSSFTEGVNNSGKISGEMAGIWVGEYDRNTDNVTGSGGVFEINHSGGSIESDKDAIYVLSGNEANLTWGDALIRGNLANLTKIDVTGDARFFGKHIQTTDGLNILNGSTLSLSEASTLIQGDLLLSNGATISATYSPEMLQDGSIIMVDGKATLASESVIAIRSVEADFAEGGRTFSVINAGELVDEGVVIIGGTEMFDFVKNVAADNTITVTATKKKVEEVKQIVLNAGANKNSANAYSAFFAAASAGSFANPNDPVFQALVAATDEASVAKLAKQLTPDVTGSATQAAAGGVTMSTSATGNRISAARSGMSSGYDMAGTGLWIQALGNDAEQDARSGIDGFTSDSKGFIIGADTKVDDFITLGAYYSNVATDTKTDLGNKSDAQTHLLGVYGSYQDGTFYVDGNLTAGRGNNESKRFIAGTTAEGDFDSSILAASVMSGNSYEFEENMFIEPRVAARYSNVKTDSYTETGSSAALSMGEQRIETGEVGVGARLSAQIGFHGGTLEPELSVMAYHDLIQDSAKGSAAYVLGGNTFTVSGAANDKATYETTLGANYRRDNMTVGLSYNRMDKSSFSADGFALKLRYDF